jgi:hypothetical protein
LQASTVEIDSAGIPAQADRDAAGAAPLVVTDAEEPVNVVVG